jgi:hypothetical protein
MDQSCLFLSGHTDSLNGFSDVLTTFVTSTIQWPITLNSFFKLCDSTTGWNFDLSNNKTITIKSTINNYGDGNMLNIKPIQYFKDFGISLGIYCQ